MEIGLVSESVDPSVTKNVLNLIATAIETQLFSHYAILWQSAGVHVVVYDRIQDVPPETNPMIVFDNPDQPDALGYHDVTPAGHAYGKVFLRPILDNGGTLTNGATSLSVTISHEALEMVGDPYANFWADMPTGEEDALELCDRCEQDQYDIGVSNVTGMATANVPDTMVSVSNFLGPRAFRNGDGPYDWLGSQGDSRGLKTPWEVRPGGYAIRRRGGPTGSTGQVFGESYPEWKKALKLHPAARFQKRASAKSPAFDVTISATFPLGEKAPTGK